MRTYKPPTDFSIEPDDSFVVFLAGSIEQGTAEDWQDKAAKALDIADKNTPLVVLNPRREDWDSSWVQSINNPQFNDQVTWELDGLERADLVVVYFDPSTKSPITLLELGILTEKSGNVIVCCPEGFWRKGNVDIVCERYDIGQVDSLDELLKFLEDI